jgi:hypothetical protein
MKVPVVSTTVSMLWMVMKYVLLAKLAVPQTSMDGNYAAYPDIVFYVSVN